MIQVSNFNKMGDVMYSLPVLRALHRVTGQRVHLLLSGSAYQLAPLLWEQPYIGEVALEDTKSHATEPMARGAIFPDWHWYRDGHGVNLSLQPAYFTDDAPMAWTHCYLQAAGLTELTEQDCVALPSLVNHRRWLEGIDVAINGQMQDKPRTIIVAPETDTLDVLRPSIWNHLLGKIAQAGYHAVLVGVRRAPLYFDEDAPANSTDLRGLTSVPVLARLIADARGFIGAHSFPWHLARHSDTPAVCLQTWREGLRRCLPVDTPYTWIDSKDYQTAVPTVLQLMNSQPVAA